MVQKLTINELMVLMKAVRERVNTLKGLRGQVSVKESWRGDEGKTIEPQYDIKLVDKKIMELENFIFQADSRIKSANAKVKVDLEVDVDKLLEPLQ